MSLESRAIAALAAIVPVLAVAQFRALTLAVTLGLVARVAIHWRRFGRPALPTGPALLGGLALLVWLGASALWAAEPGRALATAASLAGFILLGAFAAGAAPEDRRRTGMALLAGLGMAGSLACFDQLSGHWFRAAIRGLAAPTPTLGFGLKPALSTLAVLLPIGLFWPGLPAWSRLLVLPPVVAAAAVVPAEAAKLALVAGLAAGLLTVWLGRRVIGWLAGLTAIVILMAPLLTAAILPRLPPIDSWPRSAAHRVLIYDFVLARVAERPWLGWGGEAARTVPGGHETFPPATLARFGLDSPDAGAWFARPDAQALPLHAHNMALQLWLELGAVGAVLGATLIAALGWAASRAALPPGAAGAFAAAVTVGGLSFGIWQEWWWGVVLFAACLLAGQRTASAASVSASAG